ncbi:MAG: (d)CMP kinase [Planctomycetes bacterium]|nr:(d)CMP kinase [Planctomycetota bacterium]
MIITIDGPAGSGKSTAARHLAERLGLAYLDTGAMYRAVTLRALRQEVDLTDGDALTHCAAGAALSLRYDDGRLRVLLDGQDVSEAIRSVEVTDNSHYLASTPGVRDVLVALQRRAAGDLGDVVTEGRDQGSVVFPDATVKFFLVADPDVRARRRYDELRAKGQDVGFDAVRDAMAARDRRDAGRDVAPLVRPDGAIEVDTTGLSIEQVIDVLARHVEAAR